MLRNLLMKSKPSFWQKIGLHEWFLKKDPDAGSLAPSGITPNDVFHYIGEKFDESVRQLSFANRVVFYHEYIISFSTADYQEFMESKKGIFGLIQYSDRDPGFIPKKSVPFMRIPCPGLFYSHGTPLSCGVVYSLPIL